MGVYANTSLFMVGGLKFDNNYEHTPLFTSLADQLSYFDSRPNREEYNDFNFVAPKQSPTISFIVAESFDNLWDKDYVYYRNDTGKWIFAFITEKRFVAKSSTQIFLEIDVAQTYQFDLNVNPSFILREHQDRWTWDNNPANPPLPIYSKTREDIDYGEEYEKRSTVVFGGVDTSLVWFLLVTTESITSDDPSPAQPVQGVPTPYFHYLVPCRKGDTTSVLSCYGDDISQPLANGYGIYQEMRSGAIPESSVVSYSQINYVPFDYTVSNGNITFTPNAIGAACQSYKMVAQPPVTQDLWIYRIQWYPTIGEFTTNLGSVNKTLGFSLPYPPEDFAIGQGRYFGYESKLLTHPYRYWLLSDYRNEPMVVKQEYVDDGVDNTKLAVFVDQSLLHNPQARYYVNGYNGDSGRDSNVIDKTVNDFPITSTAYLDYIRQSRAQAISGIALNTAGAALTIGGLIATGGAATPLVAGAALGSLGAVSGELAKRKDLKNVPPSVKSQGNNIQFDLPADNTNLRLMLYEIHDQFREIVHDYFTLFGYKANELKIPNFRSRYYFNYIKTAKSNVSGDIDSGDMAKIKSILEKGITFWHKRPEMTNTAFHNGMLDYTYENIEMSLL